MEPPEIQSSNFQKPNNTARQNSERPHYLTYRSWAPPLPPPTRVCVSEPKHKHLSAKRMLALGSSSPCSSHTTSITKSFQGWRLSSSTVDGYSSKTPSMCTWYFSTICKPVSWWSRTYYTAHSSDPTTTHTHSHPVLTFGPWVVPQMAGFEPEHKRFVVSRECRTFGLRKDIEGKVREAGGHPQSRRCAAHRLVRDLDRSNRFNDFSQSQNTQSAPGIVRFFMHHVLSILSQTSVLSL